MPAGVNGGNGRRRKGPRTSSDDYAPIKEACRLRDRGTSWEEIAGLTGYASAGAVRMAVHHWMQQAADEVSVDERREALREAVHAYDALIEHWYESALDDYYALDRVLKIMAQRDRIKGLDRTKEDTGTGSVLVIGGDHEEYMAGLERVIQDPN